MNNYITNVNTITQKRNESESQTSTPSDDIKELLQSACELFNKVKPMEQTLLADRIEIGRILKKLKDLVGHGNFMKSVDDWVKSNMLNFSLKTAERAMAYATLHEQGKIEGVSNLAEAEEIRQREKQAKSQSKAASEESQSNQTSPPALKLTTTSAKQKAVMMSKAALKECENYDKESKRILIEELIEILNKELESCDAQ
ncbi:MAG: DUF3102 domain-containing protein [Verrucomicrobia bacterium]|nr:MAG: DUF3102 domain-containing protein [Verrucomicrobiota bacterium]